MRDFPTNQKNASIPVLNKRQVNQIRPQGELYETKLGVQEVRYETDFFPQRQTMHVALLQCMLSRWFTTTSPLRLCVSTPSASLRVEATLKPPPFAAHRPHPLVRIMLSFAAEPPSPFRHRPTHPFSVTHPSHYTLSCFVSSRSQACQTASDAKRATEDWSEAVAGPRDWFNDATADVPSSLCLLIDRLGLGNSFEAFKFGVKGKRQVRVGLSLPLLVFLLISSRSTTCGTAGR